MGTSTASEPLNSSIIVIQYIIYDLIVFSSFFMTAPLEMDALATSGIYLMINLRDYKY